MKTRTAIVVLSAALLLAGAGCGKPAPAPAPPPVNQQAEKPSSPGLPRMTEQRLDEDDHLDAALTDLDTVE